MARRPLWSFWAHNAELCLKEKLPMETYRYSKKGQFSLPLVISIKLYLICLYNMKVYIFGAMPENITNLCGLMLGLIAQVYQDESTHVTVIVGSTLFLKVCKLIFPIV